ncbi:hypothetical protein U9M48_013776 [Paspalum notatum var. saurae]|uniref:Uncharacterized protein n=1 Tax=Paspalum notatum var. saurae TaxID=547442 RepID=A0AAQ3T0L8_PASNO
MVHPARLTCIVHACYQGAGAIPIPELLAAVLPSVVEVACWEEAQDRVACLPPGAQRGEGCHYRLTVSLLLVGPIKGDGLLACECPSWKDNLGHAVALLVHHLHRDEGTGTTPYLP